MTVNGQCSSTFKKSSVKVFLKKTTTKNKTLEVGAERDNIRKTRYISSVNLLLKPSRLPELSEVPDDLLCLEELIVTDKCFFEGNVLRKWSILCKEMARESVCVEKILEEETFASSDEHDGAWRKFYRNTVCESVCEEKFVELPETSDHALLENSISGNGGASKIFHSSSNMVGGGRSSNSKMIDGYHNNSNMVSVGYDLLPYSPDETSPFFGWIHGRGLSVVVDPMAESGNAKYFKCCCCCPCCDAVSEEFTWH